MLAYSKPNLIDIGSSETLIQGECGWGIENALLDETGAKHVPRRITYQVPCSGKICVLCKEVTGCSNEKHQC